MTTTVDSSSDASAAKPNGAYRLHLMVCAGTGCVSNHSIKVKAALERELAERGLENEVQIVATGCNGFCGAGPLLLVQPDGVLYQQLKPEHVPELVAEHLLKGRPVEKLMYRMPEDKRPVPLLSDIPFFSNQLLITLRNRGLIDPENIEDYIARDGYQSLAKALTDLTPEQIIAEVTASGLRGRGGGGFPTGVKWKTCRNAHSEDGTRYVICNADEGDPGAFMDRSIIEGNPHLVLEGMIIGAYAISATHGFIYVRLEYPLALKRFMIALDQAREYGLLGDNILGTDFSFDVEVHRGAGAFVCGEATALMASIEGRVGEPRAKYVHTVERGLWNRPSCLNNVETWANIPHIIREGSDWFTQYGTGDVSENPWGGSKGTKVFSLAGKINNTGLVEVPMGITLRKIIYDIGGGIKDGKRFKAVQTGGPSGGCLPESTARQGHSRSGGRLRHAGAGRLDDGLGRHGRDGRRRLHDRRRPLLHRIPDGRVVRKVYAVPRGPAQHAPHPDADLQRAGRGRRHRAAARTRADDEGRLAVRAGHVGAEPGDQHAALLPR